MNAVTAASLVRDSTYIDIAGLPWMPTRFPGIESKMLMEDKASGLSTVLMRWAITNDVRPTINCSSAC